MQNESNPTDYSGRETLGDLSLAKNYNNHLSSVIRENFSDGDTVLDFGAGNGYYLNSISSRKANFFAVEPDEELRKRIESLEVAKVVELDNLAERSLDFIYTLNVLEHIHDDVAVLEKLFNSLSYEGRILVYVPCFPHLYSNFDRSIGHHRRYTKSELTEKLESVGFEIESARYFDPIGYFAALVYKYSSNTGYITRRQIRFFDTVLYPLSRLLLPLTHKIIGKNLIFLATKPGVEEVKDSKGIV